MDKSFLKRMATGATYDIKQDGLYFYLRNNQEEIVIIDKKKLKPVKVIACKKYVIPFRVNDFQVDEKYITVAGTKGIFCLPKTSLSSIPDRLAPIVHILSSLYGFSPGNTVFECAYDKHFSASFELDIMDYRDDTKMIMYRVIKDEKEMYRRTGVSENTQMNFQPVGPGKYRIEFHIDFDDLQRARQVVSFTIIIKPLWYQQLWFIPMLILLGASIVFYCAIKITNDQSVQKRKKLQQQLYIYDLEARSLQGQLKSHFIFNLLIPLQRYFLKGSKMEGLIYLDSFSALMRGILTGMRDRYASLQAELDFVKHYLNVQQKRFSNSFSYRINVAANIVPSEHIIPTLLIQPLLENAIEHGIDKAHNDGMITISIMQWGHTLCLTVTDNGKGLPDNFELVDNHALKIIEERITLLKKKTNTGGFSISNNMPPLTGVSAVLHLPLNIGI
ncbi:hypothetical protein DBR32_12875 [Taibaiella sp. KBW10]|uniref:sensor histidine kinase n=1 Tax=Taibaiella sp. KBW10 TaxID=2153357 RepID=UPI000F5B127D|nr:histidine kinase [Taibaiella sp. KBW10]RQO30452.1 hypothetical protein DBR32_12875 [Taibaiella sp. KBW10]